MKRIIRAVARSLRSLVSLAGVTAFAPGEGNCDATLESLPPGFNGRLTFFQLIFWPRAVKTHPMQSMKPIARRTFIASTATAVAATQLPATGVGNDAGELALKGGPK